MILISNSNKCYFYSSKDPEKMYQGLQKIVKQDNHHTIIFEGSCDTEDLSC